MERKCKAVAKLLLEHREARGWCWPWLKQGRSLSPKDANKFLLGSILDYQMRAEVAWENARRLAEDILGDPDNLWHKIARLSRRNWMSRRRKYSLHRFVQGHERVWTIGKRVVQQYEGDARKIWSNQSADTVLCRLTDLGVGEQISRMIVGALTDTRRITGKGDVKIDIHVRRVLGRVFWGNGLSLADEGKVSEITHAMHPQNPWLLDRPLYLLGKQQCHAEKPECSSCYLAAECSYHKSHCS